MTFGFILLTAGIAALVAGIKGVTIAEVFRGAIGPDNPIFKRGQVAGANSDADGAYADAAALDEPGGGRIVELFYDPLGAWKNGIRIPAIGGHDDHVHVAAPTSVVTRLQEIAASRFGLDITEPVGEDSGGHVGNSYHKRRMAFDASGTPDEMQRFAEYVRDNYVHKKRSKKPRRGAHATRQIINPNKGR